jgi:IS5 family transposase
MEGWPGLFRTCLLELMPVDELEVHFDDTMGCPTKELYSVCGLILLMEFNDWTVEQAADAYMFDGRVQFALNLGRDNQSMSTRSIERYQKIFRDDELAKSVNDRITRRLVDLLEVKVDKLRLDSTHVFSNMASFGRTRLMMTSTRRFLVQLKRHDAKLYAALPAELRDRYAKKNWEFGKGGKSDLKRETIAEDMLLLISRFEDNERVFRRTSFQDLFRIFTEQCDMIEDKVVLRKKTGGDTMQNPSDPDATFDGKKGSGYQVQVVETFSEDNEAQLIVSAIAQTANEHDQKAVDVVLEDLENNNISPSTIVADAGYGGDPNFRACQKRDVHLVAPVTRGRLKEGGIQLSDFSLDGNCIVACPVRRSPLKTWFDEEKDRGSAVFAAEHCENCELSKSCRAVATTKNYCVQYDGRALRNSLRRARISSLPEAELYAKRSGVEATFSTTKRSTGMDRLRVRGLRSVFHAILGRITGINIMRAAKTEKIRKIVWERLKSRVAAPILLTEVHQYRLFARAIDLLRRLTQSESRIQTVWSAGG